MEKEKRVITKWIYWFTFAVAVIAVYKTLDNFSDLVEENCDLNIEEKAKIREFYRKFWRPLNNEYYIFCYANFLSLVKKDTLEPKLEKFSIIDPIEQTPFILVGNNENELRLYRIKGDEEIEAIFDDLNLYVSKEDIFKLKNGRFLINVKKMNMICKIKKY